MIQDRDGLPKTHKAQVPLRPIVPMDSSPFHQLAQWLVTCLKPIRDKLCRHSLKDTFEFIECLNGASLKDQTMASFDVQSLFTSVPLAEVVDLIHDYALEHRIQLELPVLHLCKLIKLCTMNVQFIFNGQFYHQIDGVAMGSPLGPVLADIFMAFLEMQAKTVIGEATLYKRYVDDIFVMCATPGLTISILDHLNTLHRNIKFTIEHEKDDQLPFLDVNLFRRPDGSICRGIYRKKTWTGQFMHFKSFVPIAYKRAIVRTLYQRIRKICTPDMLPKEVELIRTTLIHNGYPARFIDKHSRPKPDRTVEMTVPRKPVYISLPFKGDDVALLMKRRLGAAIKRTYFAADLILLHKTARVPCTPRKEPISPLAKSNVIYQFTCTCGLQYIGRTVRRLCNRISEHIPKWLIVSGNGVTRSAITKHLHESGHVVDPKSAFRIILHVRNKRVIAPA